MSVCLCLVAALCLPMNAALAKKLPDSVDTVTGLFLDLAAYGDALSDKDLDEKGSPVWKKALLLDDMLRVVLGSHYRGLTRAQLRSIKREYGKALTRYYRSKLAVSGVTGFQFETEKDLGDRQQWLQLRGQTVDGRPLSLGFILRTRSGRLQIMNIVLNDVSLLAAQRTRMNAIVEQHGAEALAKHIAPTGK